MIITKEIKDMVDNRHIKGVPIEFINPYMLTDQEYMIYKLIIHSIVLDKLDRIEDITDAKIALHKFMKKKT